MKRNSKFKLIISEITAVAINIIPLALWFFEDYSVETIVVLYALESVLAMIFALLCVLLLSAAKESSDDGKFRTKSEVVKSFLLVCGMGTLIVLVFPATFIFLFGKGEGVSFSDVKFALYFILAFQLFEFVSNLYLLRPLSLKEGEFLLSFSFGGIALLLISIFIGVFLTVFFNISVFLPFIILKTITDIGQPIQCFLGQTPSHTQPIFRDATVKSQIKFWRK